MGEVVTMSSLTKERRREELSRAALDVEPALAEYFALKEKGLTPSNLKDFLNRCEMRGGVDFAAELSRHIAVFHQVGAAIRRGDACNSEDSNRHLY